MIYMTDLGSEQIMRSCITNQTELGFGLKLYN